MTPTNEGIPPAWTTARLGDVLPLTYGKGLTQSARNEAGAVPVVGSSGVVGAHDTPLTNGPALVIGRKGTVGSVHHSRTPCWPIDTVYYSEAFDGVNLAYFEHLLRFLELRRLDKSTAVPGLSRDDYNVVEAPLAPFNEQHRIVEAIESYFTRLDDAMETLERVQRNLKRYRASVLKAAVEGRLVPTEAELARAEGRDYEPASVLLERILTERRRRWEEAELAKMKAKGTVPKNDAWKAKYKEPAPPDTTGLPELPEGWCWASPGQFFSWSSGEFLPKKNQIDGTFPVFGGNGINGSHNAFLVESPTLVIGRVGAHCGNVHLTGGPAWITDNAIYASYAPDTANLDFWRFVMSEQNLNANAGGTGQPYVNQKHLNDLVVPLPPESEQIRIVSELGVRLSVAHHAENVLNQAAARCTRLRQAILKWAFEGKLADQEPSDEPASVLIERIRRERAAATTTKTKRSPGRKPREAREPDPAETLNALLDDVHESPRIRPSSKNASAAATPPRPDAPDDDAITVAIHAAAAGPGKPRDELLKDVSLALGYKRLGKNIRQELSNHIKTAVRRGVLENVGGLYRLARS